MLKDCKFLKVEGNPHIITITSVKRLKDGKIFQIGDAVLKYGINYPLDYGIIDRIEPCIKQQGKTKIYDTFGHWEYLNETVKVNAEFALRNAKVTICYNEIENFINPEHLERLKLLIKQKLNIK